MSTKSRTKPSATSRTQSRTNESSLDAPGASSAEGVGSVSCGFSSGLAARTPASASSRVARTESAPYLRGNRFAIRRSYRGHQIYLGGFKTEAATMKALRRRMQEIDDGINPVGAGPEGTTLAQALQDYAMARLPFLKGAEQEARRINAYLREAGLRLLEVEKLASVPGAAGASGAGAFFSVRLVAHTSERVIPQGLGGHRRALLTSRAESGSLRRVLATTPMSEVTRDVVQRFVDQMRKDGNSPATIGLERALLRVLFNYAFTTWRWQTLRDNPATMLKMPKVDNVRKRVLSFDEQAMLDAALAECRNQMVEPTLALLRETAMRASEPIEHAVWADVDWERSLLHLSDAKAGQRDVPLSPAALQALQRLRELNPGEPHERIVQITYNALAAAWRRALKRAGIDGLRVHDLRRTAATRMALDTGNVFLVKALTGHKTLSMLERYINVTAEDVVAVMHGNAAVPGHGFKPSLMTQGQSDAPMDLSQDGQAEREVAAGIEEQGGSKVPECSNVVYLPLRRRA